MSTSTPFSSLPTFIFHLKHRPCKMSYINRKSLKCTHIGRLISSKYYFYMYSESQLTSPKVILWILTNWFKALFQWQMMPNGQKQQRIYKALLSDSPCSYSKEDIVIWQTGAPRFSTDLKNNCKRDSRESPLKFDKVEIIQRRKGRPFNDSFSLQ